MPLWQHNLKMVFFYMISIIIFIMISYMTLCPVKSIHEVDNLHLSGITVSFIQITILEWIFLELWSSWVRCCIIWVETFWGNLLAQSSTLKMEVTGSPKFWYLSLKLHGFTHKIIIFIANPTRTSNSCGFSCSITSLLAITHTQITRMLQNVPVMFIFIILRVKRLSRLTSRYP